MEYFYKHVMSESAKISKIVSEPKDMLPLTEQEQTDYDRATTCAVCTKSFELVNPKVKHHDHIDGKYICAACNNCNLTLKYPNRKHKVTEGHRNSKNDMRKRKATKGHMKTKKGKLQQSAVDDEDDMCDEEDVKENEQYETNYFLPVVFHNLKCYDAHFVIKHFKKQYTAHFKTEDHDNDNDELEDDNATYDDVVVTPLNTEKYLSFQVGNLRFLDSFQFLSTSLENLVSLLLKSGRDKFVHTTKYLEDHDLVFAKGVYPYSYMSGPEKFLETQQPSIENFHDTLNDEDLSEKDYERAKQIWTILESKRFKVITITTCCLMFCCWPMCLKIFATASMMNSV